jgi:hypothetical protein
MLAAAPTSIPPQSHPSFSLRLRSAIATLGLTLFGVRGTCRSARWLATRAAANAARTPGRAHDLIDAGRARLGAATDGLLARHRANHSAAPTRSRLRAALPTLAQTAQDAADQVTRLEAQIPPGAIEEPLGLLLRLLLGASLITEGLVCYLSLGATPLAESPVVLLASALTATALATALLHKSGVLIRRCVWHRRVSPTASAAIALGILVPVTLGVGLVLSRVDAATAGRTAALWTAAGLQGVLLTLPLVAGYLHAVPVGGLTGARRRRAAAVRAHDRAAAALALVEARAAAEEVRLLTQQTDAHREFDTTVTRLLPAAVRIHAVNDGARPSSSLVPLAPVPTQERVA